MLQTDLFYSFPALIKLQNILSKKYATLEMITEFKKHIIKIFKNQKEIQAEWSGQSWSKASAEAVLMINCLPAGAST